MFDSNLKFHNHRNPIGDFFITQNINKNAESKFFESGAVRYFINGWYIYTWNIPIRKDNISFTGFGVIDGRFIIGPKLLSHAYNLTSGTYCLINIKDENNIIVTPDNMGMYQLFYSSSLVTNRLHLAKIYTQSFEQDLIYSNFLLDNMLFQQWSLFDTPISGTKILPALSDIQLSASGNVIVNSQDVFEGELSPFEYKRLIQEGAEEIKKDIVAITNSGLPVMADISGGKDSRVIFSALKSTNKINNVFFNTRFNGRNHKDLEIAPALVEVYGGSYESQLEVKDFVHFDYSYMVNQRRSQLFGMCHDFDLGQFRTSQESYTKPFIRLLGGCGELYRNYYQDLFNLTKKELASNDFSLIEEKMYSFESSCAQISKLKDYLVGKHVETFKKLSSYNLEQSLDNHYLNFRNRFHFGLKTTEKEGVINISPAANIKILKASRGLPQNEKDSGRVLFDLMYALDNRLPFYNYDSYWDISFVNSEYSIKKIENPELIGLVANTGFYDKFNRNQRHVGNAKNFKMKNNKTDKQISVDLLEFSIEKLKGSERGWFLDQDFIEKIYFYSESKPLRFNTWVSRLVATYDF